MNLGSFLSEYQINSWWAFWGFFGQLVFSMRFLIQWIASEKKKQSVIPVAFWYLSIVGSLMVLTYAIYIKNAVFILGQSIGSLIYTRNLILIYKKDRAGS